MAERTIAVISAGLSKPSSTRLLADRLGDAAARRLIERGDTVKVEVIELRDLAHDITNNLLTGFPSSQLESAIEKVLTADGVIAVTPIFTASYNGLFKSFFDIIEPGSLIDMPVLLAATGGTARHSLAIDYALRPLFAYLHADVASTGVFASTDDWGSDEDGVKPLPERIDRAAEELVGLVTRSTRSKVLHDPWALPAGFRPNGPAGLE
ncbi:FMN reductase [Amnibacterium flavum]|uniref:NADPH-dependent FMN reductase n=1 Tax=Amnibacterium flavum TaxID=2173173 RepID=A0A2V1HTC1_9MICO|nr:FMN reductase [Amnibacterium flavum]PVZ93567.1 NADPH-dependent FMN reductase [Amnibacterium flavum]